MLQSKASVMNYERKPFSSCLLKNKILLKAIKRYLLQKLPKSVRSYHPIIPLVSVKMLNWAEIKSNVLKKKKKRVQTPYIHVERVEVFWEYSVAGTSLNQYKSKQNTSVEKHMPIMHTDCYKELFSLCLHRYVASVTGSAWFPEHPRSEQRDLSTCS